MNDATLSVATRLDPPIDESVDHALGPPQAQITLVEYGSFDCSFCRGAHEVIANLRDRFGDRLRYVFRHRPITGDDIARQAAELVEYAHRTRDRYWEAHEALMKLGPALEPARMQALAQRLDLPPVDPEDRAWAQAQAKVERDVASARRSGAPVSPTFFINGRRYEGPWDEATLSEAMLGALGHRVQAAALDFARWAPSTGLVLLLMAAIAIVLANTPAAARIEALWTMPFGFAAGDAAFRLPVREWINDGLLTLFFLVVGLEVKRELTVGRLANPRAAALPIAAAVGGMAFPAALYLLIVPSGPLAAGWAVPTTTDTAFAIALIALLGPRVPVELRIFLTAAVIVDDLVAIAVVAIFYSGRIDVSLMLAALGVTAALAVLNRSSVYRALPYALLGVVLWAFLHGAGLHATLAGVLLAVFTPTRPPANLRALMAQAESVLHAELGPGRERAVRHGPSEPALRALDAIHNRIESPADKLLRTVQPWSSYVVLPLFALANAGLAFSGGMIEGRGALVGAIFAGLVIGKPLGMLSLAALAVRLRWAVKPDAYTWAQLAGAGALAGLGFTMSLYIAQKAFPDAADFAAAKLAIFAASCSAGAIGVALLRRRS
ncbi:MAG TPA: Na+/H+ antiporter NhaA [Burkholderiaceae bacterium]|nr:Na+/H+ antiporter NhaA [Burkholderiaceae bacterium]